MLFRARDVDPDVVYRPPWHDLHGPAAVRQRILAVLASPAGWGIAGLGRLGTAARDEMSCCKVRRWCWVT